MKRLNVVALCASLMFALSLSPKSVFAEEEEPSPRINSAIVSIGYVMYRDTAMGCTDCWDFSHEFSGYVNYNNYFYKTGAESCRVSGDSMTCYYQFNIDGQYRYIYN
ncbi:MAG: hypothetical protein HUJ56_04160 [Erysipelotrichaceae bacterium]|nr:hypothetical protein [Erysipelotrichaceae bacterium]